MSEHKFARIDAVRNYADDILKDCEDKEAAGCGFVQKCLLYKKIVI